MLPLGGRFSLLYGTNRHSDLFPELFIMENGLRPIKKLLYFRSQKKKVHYKIVIRTSELKLMSITGKITCPWV
jgi:hypothetical protein